MTDKQKFEGIVERLKAEGWCDDPMFISIMVIIGYMNELQKLGLMDCPYALAESGRKIITTTEEFDWKPSDDDINRFASELVDGQDQSPIVFMLRRWRDNKEEFLDEVKKFRESGEGNA